MEDDDTQQKEEIEALVSIYDNLVNILPSSSGRALEICIEKATLSVNLPSNYPSESTAKYELSAPFLSRDQKEQLESELQDAQAPYKGMPVIFTLVQCVKDFLEIHHFDNSSSESLEKTNSSENDTKSSSLTSSKQCPAIITGDCFEDRKSVFQGHYACVETLEDVNAVIEKLYENRKIANATHNMYAYRIKQPGGKTFLQDCDDDGETNAGGRMLHLLEILDCQNVLVVVSRWYGGIQLGPDRFKHINNMARNVLEIAGVVSDNKKSKENKNKRK